MSVATTDRLEELVALVAGVEPGLGAELVREVLLTATPSLGARTRLLKQLKADPSLLTSGSAAATRLVSRVALALVDAGASRVVAPRCARCNEAVLLTKRTSRGGICAACYNRARTADCVRCGRHRRIAGRDPDGQALCSSCRARDPDNHVACSGCGRMAPVNTRTAMGKPLCGSCYRAPVDRCDRCGQLGAINSRAYGEALCRRCYRTPPRPCGRCGRLGRIARRARDGEPDLCPNCHWAPSGTCSRCGEHGLGFGVRAGALVCLRCSAADRLDALITRPDGTRPAALRGLRDAFLAAEQPRSIHTWLDRSPARHLLSPLATGELELTHDALDALAQPPSLTHLRALLVACGALPERDAHLARLEHSVAALIASVVDPDDRRLLRAYATWRVLHRLRRRADGHGVSAHAADSARDRLAHVARFLAWLRDDGQGLEQATQTQLDAWLAAAPRARAILGPFLPWAVQRHAAPDLTLPRSVPSPGPVAISAEARWTLARRLLHDDDSLDVGDRVAGALVVLYAQPVARIAQLRRSDITDHDGDVLLRLGHERVLMPDPLGDLVRRLPARRQVGPSGAVPAAAQWLFPGRHAGRPQHPEHIRKRLGTLGIQCRGSRNAALLQLATEVPAAVLADTLGLSANTAVRWTKTAGGDWTRYAARRARLTSTGLSP